MSAIFSSCRTYRYCLERCSTPLLPGTNKRKTVGWIMLNPSTADEQTNDPTIRRVVRYSNDWGYPRVLVGNLFPYRATKPVELRKWNETYLLGEFGVNDSWLNNISRSSDMVVFAWGNGGHRYHNRVDAVINMLMKRATKCYVLGYTANGEPLHPLMQPADLKPVQYVRSM